jgi:hypothetical protein
MAFQLHPLHVEGKFRENIGGKARQYSVSDLIGGNAHLGEIRHEINPALSNRLRSVTVMASPSREYLSMATDVIPFYLWHW